VQIEKTDKILGVWLRIGYKLIMGYKTIAASGASQKLCLYPTCDILGVHSGA